jgi:hypothetical protein
MALSSALTSPPSAGISKRLSATQGEERVGDRFGRWLLYLFVVLVIKYSLSSLYANSSVFFRESCYGIYKKSVY